VKENEIDFFLYILLAGIWNKNAYKIYLRNLANIYSRDELEIMIDNCICIKDSFKEKCLFIYDSPDFISDVLLNNMYFELILIIQCVIGILSNEEFEELMYNPNYYYREDKKIAYTIIEENELFKVYENNLELEYCSELVKECKSKEEAIKVIEDIKGDGINEY
jgi:hypothetical protein